VPHFGNGDLLHSVFFIHSPSSKPVFLWWAWNEKPVAVRTREAIQEWLTELSPTCNISTKKPQSHPQQQWSPGFMPKVKESRMTLGDSRRDQVLQVLAGFSLFFFFPLWAITHLDILHSSPPHCTITPRSKRRECNASCSCSRGRVWGG